VVSSVELDVGSLPLVTIPPPLALTERPAQLPTADAAGLSLINPNATVAGPNASVQRAGTNRRIEASTGLPTSITLASNSSPQERIAVACSSNNSGVASPLRWETFSLRPDGVALWAVHDGWFDPVGCRLVEQRQVVAQPRALALLADQPVAFAIRTPEGLVILYPFMDNLLGDAMTGPVKTSRGTISRVTLPLARGASATVVSTHNLARTASWLAAAEGKASGGVSLGQGTLTLRIEVTQTVSEDSPTLLLNLRSVATR
jgi:hypothetical protein